MTDPSGSEPDNTKPFGIDNRDHDDGISLGSIAALAVLVVFLGLMVWTFLL